MARFGTLIISYKPWRHLFYHYMIKITGYRKYLELNNEKLYALQLIDLYTRIFFFHFVKLEMKAIEIILLLYISN